VGRFDLLRQLQSQARGVQPLGLIEHGAQVGQRGIPAQFGWKIRRRPRPWVGRKAEPVTQGHSRRMITCAQSAGAGRPVGPEGLRAEPVERVMEGEGIPG
jgi:hypothetical protein